MIEEDLDSNCRILVTDKAFGHVGEADASFLKRYEGCFGGKPLRVAWMNQVHGNNLEYAGLNDGQSALFPNTDGLWTDRKGVMLITKTADCVPILLWNSQDNIIAALHCGWRGFFRGIIEAFFDLCQKNNFGIENFSAYLGPHLRLNNFQIKYDFMEQVPDDKKIFIKTIDGKEHYDLTEAVSKTLLSHGISRIKDSGIDTYTDPNYFSYRVWKNTPEKIRPADYRTFANCIISK